MMGDLHRYLSGATSTPPEEYILMRLARAYGALPFSGGILEQPLRLVVLGDMLCDYAQAYATFEADEKNAPPDVKRWVFQVMAANAMRTDRS